MTVLFTSETCAWCPTMKKYLDRFGVNFIEKSVNDPVNAEEAYKLSGTMTVPILVVDEADRKGVVIGLNYRRISELLTPVLA